MTKFFELQEASAIKAFWIMSIVVERCVGKQTDPDTDKDWTGYQNVTVSIVRSSKGMPDAMENHNVVSNNVYEFTVAELALDAGEDNYNPKVAAIGKAVTKLAIRRCSSHFFLKIDLE